MGKLEDLFEAKKPVIGMIHLAGGSQSERIDIALEEMRIYEREGVSGAIIEDYECGILEDLIAVASAINKEKFNVVMGVNCLRKPFLNSYISDEYGGKFIQFDSVQGDSFNDKLDMMGQFVLGGVGFKYQPKSGNSLRHDLVEGMARCDAVVTTGDGTGIETPVEKLVAYKNILGDFPLIVGAGLNPCNAYEQLKVADGGIVGSCFKPGKNTSKMVDRGLVRDFIHVVRGVRAEN